MDYHYCFYWVVALQNLPKNMVYLLKMILLNRILIILMMRAWLIIMTFLMSLGIVFCFIGMTLIKKWGTRKSLLPIQSEIFTNSILMWRRFHWKSIAWKINNIHHLYDLFMIMKKCFIWCLFFCVALLFGCSRWPELSIQKIDNYNYTQKTALDTQDFNESWNVMNSGTIEERYRIKDKKLGISMDYLHSYYSGERSDIQVYRITWMNNNQEFLRVRWWDLGIIESDASITNTSDFLNTIRQSNTGFLLSWCELKMWANHSTLSQLFTGDRYLSASYSDYFNSDENKVGMCPYSHELLMYPTFVFDTLQPKRILVIVDRDGRSGLNYRKGMGTLRW